MIWKFWIFPFVFVIFLTGESAAQFYDYLKYDYKWKDDKLPNLEVDPLFQNEEVVILDEDLKFTVRSVKNKFQRVYVERHFRAKILTPEGLMKVSQYRLPESFDPLLECSDVPLTERPLECMPQVFNSRMVFFAARIHTGDDWKDAELNIRHGSKNIYYLNLLDSAFFYQFSINNLKVGDELEVHYKIEIPYNDNVHYFCNWRVFFHSWIPKQQFQLTISKPGNLLSKFFGEPPHQRYKKRGREIRVWKWKNLFGSLLEPGARPHEELPYIFFTLKIDDPRFFNRRLNGSIPRNYWLSMVRYREGRTIWPSDLQDPNSVRVRNFIEENTNGYWEDEAVLKMSHLHNKISREFSFRSDIDWLLNRDLSTPNMGDLLHRKEIGLASSYNLYSRMISDLRLPYTTAYFMDKRAGEINKEYLSSLVFNELGFVLGEYPNHTILVPKKTQFGWMANEVPFYYENTFAFSVYMDEVVTKRDPGLFFVPLPIVNPSSNYRKTDAIVEVDLENKKLKARIKVELSGQFSTMTRGTYSHNWRDSTANPKYAVAFLENAPFAKLEKELTFVSEENPFKANARVKATADVSFTEVNGEMNLDLTGWFNPVYWESNLFESRHLPFYSDFLGTELFRIRIQINAAVNPIEREEILVDNPFGLVSLEVSNIKDGEVEVLVSIMVLKEKIEASEIHYVREFFQTLEQLEQLRLPVFYATK